MTDQEYRDAIEVFSRHLSHIPDDFQIDEHGRRKTKDGRWKIEILFKEATNADCGECAYSFYFP
ncbi:MAG: hypothetical protein WAZ60_23910 [Desulfosalsimonadaceae bacterium]